MQSYQLASGDPSLIPSGAIAADLLRARDDTPYPPYDIECLDDEQCRISIAVAGFSPSELQVVVDPDGVTVSGRKTQQTRGRRYLYRGIALRAFDRRFELGDGLTVEAARYADGL